MRLVKVIFKLKNKYGADLVDTQILNLQVNIFNTSALIGKVMRSTTEFEVAYFEDIDASLDPVAYPSRPRSSPLASRTTSRSRAS